MAKKSRRVRRKGTQPKLSQTQLAQPSQATLETREVVEEPTEAPTTVSNEVNYEKEYHYVLTDLRRLVVLAAAILAGIIILSIVL